MTTYYRRFYHSDLTIPSGRDLSLSVFYLITSNSSDEYELKVSYPFGSVAALSDDSTTTYTSPRQALIPYLPDPNGVILFLPSGSYVDVTADLATTASIGVDSYDSVSPYGSTTTLGLTQTMNVATGQFFRSTRKGDSYTAGTVSGSSTILTLTDNHDGFIVSSFSGYEVDSVTFSFTVADSTSASSTIDTYLGLSLTFPSAVAPTSLPTVSGVSGPTSWSASMAGEPYLFGFSARDNDGQTISITYDLPVPWFFSSPSLYILKDGTGTTVLTRSNATAEFTGRTISSFTSNTDIFPIDQTSLPSLLRPVYGYDAGGEEP